MAVTQQVITASTTAVPLNTAGRSGGRLIVKNTSVNAADLGTAAVTAGAGLALAAGQTLDIRLNPGEVVYAIRTGAADATIAVLRTGL